MDAAVLVPERRLPVGELLAVGAAVAFSFKAILVKLAMGYGVDPIVVLAMRMMLAAPLFGLVLLAMGPPDSKPTWRDGARLVGLGLLGFYASALLDFEGLRYLSAGLERIVLYAHPTFVVLLGAAWHGRRPSGRALGAIGVAWLGLLLAASGDLRPGAEGDVLTGVGLVLGCAVTYAGYLLALDGYGPRLGLLRVASAANIVAAVALGVHLGVVAPDALVSVPTPVWGLVGFMAVASTVLPALMLAAAISRVGSERASTLGMVGPIAATLLGWLILDEPLSAAQLAGGAVVVLGVSLGRKR